MSTDHSDSATYFYDQDDRLSVRNLTGSTASVAATYDYSAMGEKVTTITMPTATAPAVTQRYQYTGRELNASSDHYFAGR